jgi:hypothetical protein
MLCFAAARTQTQNTSKAEPALKSARSPAPAGRRMSPAPKRGEWGAGDVGAPTGAVHY